MVTALIAASIAASAVAISGTTYTWEKTFEVTKPEIECEIKVSNCRVIGCPVKVWICLKINNKCNTSCWHKCKDLKEYEWDDCEDNCKEQQEYWGINGTYSAHLHWWNGTSADWQHVKDLQEEMNITIGCWKYKETYVFTPEWEGEYKAVVTFTANSETYSFTSRD